MAYEVIAQPRIELQEYGEPVLYRADKMDLDLLASANKRWRRELGIPFDPIRVEIHDENMVKLRAEAVTGVLRIGKVDIEIAPKFLSAETKNWQTVLWRILSVVEGGHVDENLTTAQSIASQSLPDLLAEMFLKSYARGAARGLPRGYRNEQRSGSMLRGSIDTSRLGDWVARPWELHYVTDFLTDDTALARLLRWSANCLAATVKTPARSRALLEIAAGLAHVGRHPPHIADARQIGLGIQYRELEPARIVGLLLLEGFGVHHAKGNFSLSGFLWNSDLIYENYVFWLCQRAAAHQGSRVDKRRIVFGEVVSGGGTKLVTEPDVVFRDTKGTPIAVSDAKYKRLGTRPKSSDTYQLVTAAHVLGCQRVSLTYPVAQDRSPTYWRISSSLGGLDIVLTALPLNLMLLLQPKGPQQLVDAIHGWLSNKF